MNQLGATEVARLVVETLLGAGVREAVLAPGSRSGPVALALAAADRQGLLRLHVRIDEREAAYLALGMAKMSGRAVPVVTTSGTAVANLHPAMLEAWHTGLEVIAVTADRPGRLRGTGANQTTDQRELLTPVTRVDAVADLRFGHGAPTHLNVEFDQPLITEVDWAFEPEARVMLEPSGPVPTVVSPGRRTVVVAGDGAADGAGSGIADLAERAGWPILAEPSSGLRSAPTAVATGRLLLALDRLGGSVERVISLGHATISRPVTELLNRQGIEVLHLGDAQTFPGVPGPAVTFVGDIVVSGDRTETDSPWVDAWLEADRTLTAALPDDPVLEVARQVWRAAGPDGLLVLGPSQILRDVDLMADVRESGPTTLANRGLAGIDGVLSTAVGAALVGKGPAVAFMGDLTFLHGSNGLLIGAEEPLPDLTVVVLNDDGGSIFASLEQGAAAYSRDFERVYATPTGARIEDLCRGMGIAHRDVTVDGLAAALHDRRPGLEVIEVRVSREGRRALTENLATIARRLI